jgi:hypothetical protein
MDWIVMHFINNSNVDFTIFHIFKWEIFSD